MGQTFTDIKDFISDRFGSPFWLSTIISWCLINWKVSVTAVFQSSKMTTGFLTTYFESTPILYHLGLPILSGILYATLSGSFRETLEIAAKYIRSKLIEIDRSGKYYKSISIEEHNKKSQILERQLQRLSIQIEDTEQLKARNDDLHSRMEKTFQRNSEVSQILLESVFKEHSLDEVKKLRLLQNLHEKDFALTITEDDISTETQASTSENNSAPEATENSSQKQKSSKLQVPKSHEKRYKNRFRVFGDSIAVAEGDTLKDPNSLKAITATLLLVKSKSQIDQSYTPNLVGLSENVFSSCVDNLLSANLVARKGEKLVLTSNGAKRLNILLSELSEEPIVQTLDKTKSIVVDQIRSLLRERSMKREDLIDEISFHPQIPEIISEMINNKTIISEGSLLFHG